VGAAYSFEGGPSNSARGGTEVLHKLQGLTGVLQGCHTGITGVFQGCYRGVTEASEGGRGTVIHREQLGRNICPLIQQGDDVLVTDSKVVRVGLVHGLISKIGVRGGSQGFSRGCCRVLQGCQKNVSRVQGCYQGLFGKRRLCMYVCVCMCACVYVCVCV
jgi:hypothetical protein